MEDIEYLEGKKYFQELRGSSLRGRKIKIGQHILLTVLAAFVMQLALAVLLILY